MAELSADEIAETIRREGRAVVVLVASARGSTPREAGAAMLVTARETRGTIGGGSVEHRATEIARRMLAEGSARAEIDFPLGPALDQCCGGRITLALAEVGQCDLARIEAGAPLALWEGGPLLPDPAPARQVAVYGGGHIGRAVVHALAPLPFRVIWIETRAGAFDGVAGPGGVETRLTPLPEAEALAMKNGAFHLVLTHSHAIDLEIVEAILRRDAFGFLGLIGSATKRVTFARRLAERGVPPAAIRRISCPIGLPGIRDKRPAVIAASVAADLLRRDAALAASVPVAAS